MRTSGYAGAVSSAPALAKATYRVQFNGLVAAGDGGIFFELLGGAIVARIIAAPLIIKPSIPTLITVGRQTAPCTGGVATPGTIIQMDSASPAPVCSAKLYTTSPTLHGAVPGAFLQGTFTAGDIFEDTPGDNAGDPGSPIVVRAGESLVISGNTSAAGTVVLYGYIEWTESAS